MSIAMVCYRIACNSQFSMTVPLRLHLSVLAHDMEEGGNMTALAELARYFLSFFKIVRNFFKLITLPLSDLKRNGFPIVHDL